MQRASSTITDLPALHISQYQEERPDLRQSCAHGHPEEDAAYPRELNRLPLLATGMLVVKSYLRAE